MAGGATVVAVATESADPDCAEAAARIDMTVHRLDAVEAATAEADGPWARHVAGRVRAALDTYASSWREAWLQACAATRGEGGLPPATARDLREQCLDERLVDVDEVSSALAAGTDPDRALRATAGLQPITDCNDPAHLAVRTPLPADPTRRRAIEIVRRKLLATQFEPDPIDAAVDTSDLVDDAAHLDYPPLHVEALRIFGLRQLQGGKLAAGLHNLEQSLLLALESTDHAAAIEALLLLARHDGRTAARQWLAQAEALLRGVARSGALEAELRLVEGEYHLAGGNDDEARRALQRARALFDEHAPDALEAIGRTHLLLADLAEGDASRRHREQARTAWQTFFGPGHPRLDAID